VHERTHALGAPPQWARIARQPFGLDRTTPTPAQLIGSTMVGATPQKQYSVRHGHD
jgi:hypothetical protein